MLPIKFRERLKSIPFGFWFIIFWLLIMIFCGVMQNGN